MNSKTKIYCKLIVDTREQKLQYIKPILDKRIGKDGISLKEYEIKTCTPLGATKSTGDLTLEISKDNIHFFKTSFCIEIKKGMDMFSTLWTNGKRFKNELERTKNIEKFYIVHDYTLNEIVHEIERNYMKGYLKSYAAVEGFSRAYLKLCEEYPVICSGQSEDALSVIVRRLVKEYIKSNKKKLLDSIPDCIITRRKRRKRRKK